MIAAPASSFDAFWPNARILDTVRRIADGPLAACATRIDEGHYPLDIMAQLGEAGAFAAHLECGGRRFDVALDAMRHISRRCGATGFLAWCHDVCGLYMEQSGNPALTGATLEAHMTARTFGGTALSNPMKSLAGIEKMLLRAVPVNGGYLVSGALPWVSHIAHGQYCGALASVFNEDSSVSREIMFLLKLDENIALRPCPKFSGMEGTSTWGIRLQNYFVGQDALIADPARPFVQRIRGAFILLQIGMALGVIQGSLDDMRTVEPMLGHVNRFLHDRPDELQAEFDDLYTRVMHLAQTPYETDPDYLLDVLDARAQGGELSLRAAQSALMHQGARGYLHDAAPQRRVRESHFIAIVTPAIKHLRWEMDRLSKQEMPA